MELQPRWVSTLLVMKLYLYLLILTIQHLICFHMVLFLTGLKLDFSISDDISLMLGVFNQTDQTEANYDRYTAFGAQTYGQYINYLGGDGYSQIDFWWIRSV